MSYRDYAKAIFPYSLLTTSKPGVLPLILQEVMDLVP